MARFGERREEGAAGVLEGADEKVVEPLVVGERGLGDRVTALPAADEVEEAVDTAEALDQRRRPALRRLGIEQVDGAGVDSVLAEAEVGREGVEALLADVGEREGGAGMDQAVGNRGAQAARGAGDRDHAAFERAHAVDATWSRGRWRTCSSFGWSWR